MSSRGDHPRHLPLSPLISLIPFLHSAKGYWQTARSNVKAFKQLITND